MILINLNLSTILIYQNKKDFNLFLMDYSIYNENLKKYKHLYFLLILIIVLIIDLL